MLFVDFTVNHLLAVTVCNKSYPFRYGTGSPATGANMPRTGNSKIYTHEAPISGMRLYY